MKYAYAVLGLGILAVAIAGFLLTKSDGDIMGTLKLTSSAFENGGVIPSKYTCDGDRLLNPPLSISGVPVGTKSLVLLMDDPDIPQHFKEGLGIEAFDHWVLYAIPPETTEIKEGNTIGSLGLNTAQNEAYTGPCPPPEYEPTEHRYIFKLYALSGTLNFIKAPTLGEVKTAIKGMIIDEAELTGTYDRKN